MHSAEVLRSLWCSTYFYVIVSVVSIPKPQPIYCPRHSDKRTFSTTIAMGGETSKDPGFKPEFGQAETGDPQVSSL